MKLVRGLPGLALALGLFSSAVPGQDTVSQDVEQLKGQVKDLEEQHSRILKDLEEIKKLLSSDRPQAQAQPASGQGKGRQRGRGAL